jgi:RNA-directed DNA polymerase
MVARPNNPAGDGDSGGGAVGKPFAKARQLQRGLYAAAKRSRDRRFHALYVRICRGDVLAEAWERDGIPEARMPHVKAIGTP